MTGTPKIRVRQALAAAFLLVACAAVPALLLAWGRAGRSDAGSAEPLPDAGMLPLEATTWDVHVSRGGAESLMGLFFDVLREREQEEGAQGEGSGPPDGVSVPARTPIFVTVYRPGERAIMVAAREADLLDGVRRSARAVREQIGDADTADLRVRMDFLCSCAPLQLRQRLTFLTRGFGEPVGLALRHEGRLSFFLPAEIVDYRAHDHESMASVICRQAGVDPQRVMTEDLDLWRLETIGFVNTVPGGRHVLASDRGLAPIGEPNLARLLRATRLLAEYLLDVQSGTGAFLTFWDVASGLKGGCESLPEQSNAAGALGVFCELRPEHEYVSADYSAVSYLMSFTETDSQRPDMAYTRRQEICRVVWELEATAGALEAVCRFRRAAARTDVDPWISALAEFLLFMQREDGLCDVRFDPETREKTTPAAGRGVVPQAKAALGLLLAYRELQFPRYLVAGRRLLDALAAGEHTPEGYSAAEARWVAVALSELATHEDAEICRERLARIADARRTRQLLPADAPAPDLAGGSLEAFPPTVAATADDLIVFASACRIGAGDLAANREAARLAAAYVMRFQFLTENSYYLSDPDDGRGGVREQPGNNIVRLPTMAAALHGLTMLARIEMRSRAND